MRYTESFVNDLAKKLLEWIEVPDNYWLGKFAQENKMHRNRFPELAKSHKVFGEAYALAKQAQENKIVEMAIKSKNAAFHIFTLKNVADWRDKTELDHGIQDETLQKYKEYGVKEVAEALNQFTSRSTGRAKVSDNREGNKPS